MLYNISEIIPYTFILPQALVKILFAKNTDKCYSPLILFMYIFYFYSICFLKICYVAVSESSIGTSSRYVRTYMYLH